MNRQRQREVPVLIVGAGPAGLTTAIVLARYGVETLVVERRRELSDLPRATLISTRSMELLRSWELEEAIRATEIEVEWLGRLCETLASAAAGSSFPVGVPSREQSAVISPTTAACVPQDQLEPVLLDHLRTLGPATVELGTELVGVESRPDGAHAVLRDVGSGESQVVHARYLVAADGAHSRVRAGLGIAMRGPDRLSERFITLFRAPLWKLLGEHRYVIYGVTHPDAPGNFVAAGRGDRWIYAGGWDPEREQLADYSEERLTRLIRIGAGAADLQPRFERIRAFSYAAQLAESFRRDSVFLVGDAAHRVTPRGGTGMNTAIHDGHNLGWKLAWVLLGWGEPALLDSYEDERRPVAEHNLARSADPNGSVRDVADELHADLGDRIAHLWVPSTAGRVSTLDLLGPGWTMFAGPEWAGPVPSPPGPPLVVRTLDAMSARALGVGGGGALLARPDGARAGWWPHGTAAMPALHAAVRGAIAA